MSSWTPDDLQRIASTDDLHIAPLRDDGVTYGTLTLFCRLSWMTACTCVLTTE
jgi:hypothetical protein